VLDYDKEAARYDATRGGDARADAAAEAIASLLPASPPPASSPSASPPPASPPPTSPRRGGARLLVDLACGTGIVTVRLTGTGRAPAAGWRAVGVDRSPGMAAVAARRLPGRIAVGDATRIPLAAGSAGAVTIVWLLHLLGHDESEQVIAEAARVLGPGGLLITTVDKNDAAYLTGDDIAGVIAPVRAEAGDDQSDAAGRVVTLGRKYGLEPAGQATFAGLGQGISPRESREQLRDRPRGWVTRVPADRRKRLDDELAALPDQDRARQNPVYKLLSLRKTPGHD
jgi:SAM-dependent methyltransferase